MSVFEGETRRLDQLGRATSVGTTDLVGLQPVGGVMMAIEVQKLFGGTVAVSTVSATAVGLSLDFAAGAVALVYAEPGPGKSGYYVKSGASGVGSWAWSNFLSAPVLAELQPAIDQAVSARDLANHYANDNSDTDVSGGGPGSRGAKWWNGVAQAAAATASSLVSSISGILTSIANIPGIAWYIGDTFGQMAAWITTTGEFNAAQAHVGTLIADSVPSLTVGTFAASTGAFGSLTVTAAPTFAAGLTIGDQLHSVVTIPGLPRVWVDSYDQMALAPWADGSIQISALRDNAGALVYPQVAQAKSDAATALSTATSAATAAAAVNSALRSSLIASQKTFGAMPKVCASTDADLPTVTVTNTVTQPSGTAQFPWNATGVWRTNGGFTYQSQNTAGTVFNPFLRWGAFRVAGNAGQPSIIGAGCNGCAVETDHTGTELHLDILGNSTPITIQINGKFVPDTTDATKPRVFTLDSSGVGRWQIKLAFGSSATRRIRLEAAGTLSFGGMFVKNGDTIAQPPARSLIVFTGDSHFQGVGSTVYPCWSYANWLARRIGADCHSTAIGGSGIMPNAPASQLSLRDRSLDYTNVGNDPAFPAYPKPKAVIDENGTNDALIYHFTSYATIETEYRDEYRRNLDLHFAANPGVPWIGLSPHLVYRPQPLQTSSGYPGVTWAGTPYSEPYAMACYYRICDAKRRALEEYGPLGHYIELGQAITGGTQTAGFTGNPNSLGNADRYRGGDGDGMNASHMPNEGHEFMGDDIAGPAVMNLIATRL